MLIRSLLVAALGVAALGASAVPARASAHLHMQAPSVALRVGGRADVATLPLRVSWAPAPTAGSSVARYALERSTDSYSGMWLDVPLPTALSRTVIVRVAPWNSHRFRVRATYQDGSTTAWAESAPRWLSYAHERDLAASYTSKWTSHSGSKAHGGTRLSSTTAGATASFTFTGTRVAWIGRYGPDRGRARVYLDGKLMATVDLRRSRTRHRRVAFATSWSLNMTRTLRIEVEGTAGRPTVDVDAFVVLGPPTSQTIVGAGDIGRCGSRNPEVTAQLVEAVGGIVYTTGDNAYPYGTTEDFAECYDPSWGRFKGRTRPSPGNHDYGTAGAAPYFAYFRANAGPAGRGWYTYQAGTWRIYSLNSEKCTSSNSWCAPGTPQYDWLHADLVANRHSCVLAYWHRPRFSSGPHGSSTRMATITKLLYDNGADVALAGHDHLYERLARLAPNGAVDNVRGIRHFTVGTGGTGLYAFNEPKLSTHVTGTDRVHGVLRLDVHPGRYNWEFLPTVEGAFSDSGSGTCH